MSLYEIGILWQIGGVVIVVVGFWQMFSEWRNGR